MRPKPTTPSVLPVTSMPPNLERSQRPCTRLACAWGMLRAWETSSAMACSAADSELEPAALQTTMPRRVAAGTSTLSTPVPARPDHLQAVGTGDQLGRDLGRAADDDGVVVGDAVGELLRGPIQAEIDAEQLGEVGDAGVGDLLADQDPQARRGEGA